MNTGLVAIVHFASVFLSILNNKTFTRIRLNISMKVFSQRFVFNVIFYQYIKTKHFFNRSRYLSETLIRIIHIKRGFLTI